METYTDTTTRPTYTDRSGRPPLRRAYHGRMLAGVAAGLADYLNVDATLIRIAFVVFTFLGGAGIPAYLACLLLVPEEGTDESIASSLLDSFSRGDR
jgi:phage shock protein C